MIRKIYLALLVTILAAGALSAQNVDFHLNGMGFFDNREYKDFVARSRTYSGVRIAADVGFNIDSNNHFIFGANALHEFGGNPFFVRVNPVAYYSYTGKNWLFNAGAFSREGLLTDYPRAMLNDTLRYFRPNVEGLLTRFKSNHVTETVWIDWVSRQTNTDREQFLFGFSGKYQPSLNSPFYVSHYFFLLHDAGAAILLPNDHIQDNGAAQVKIGADLSHRTFLDSLSIEAGGMLSLERTRGVDDFQKPKGFVANAYLSYKRFALFDEFYKGDGHRILFGDAFYEKSTYNRLDIIYTPFIAKGLKGQFVFSLHNTPGYSSNQEAFRLIYDIGRKNLVKFKD
ncbi:MULTISPECIES: hypothetical protein [unclassified Mucilaginibacter]|uniref:hypothetical protein n=1 Tax=unclassified Mucilaginibacter TaxID=2617802 RepID=UPI002AC9AE28|nr:MULTISPECIES: hypothetical protein [unclassified Mucilaginibacter]MEB0262373.1 hypothetical protein [Mucilaginibacter sp. 10I4]MEB0280458.1 hypothetical protein [Mucilaginibacter sp. 10B2]MEB0300432.1 hypothetical protein [Mucilaginibacter sp. 5C4]WPX23133.1 hypothetical protein RHM67_17780 [Mucilaginibacter sp. 5C4]